MLGNYNKVFEGIRVDGKQKGKLINYIVKGAGKQSNSQTVKHNKECEECHVKVWSSHTWVLTGVMLHASKDYIF